jgi:hypothetical protein
VASGCVIWGCPAGKSGGGLCALLCHLGGGQRVKVAGAYARYCCRGCVCVYLVLGGFIGGIGSVGVWRRLWSNRHVGAIGGGIWCWVVSLEGLAVSVPGVVFGVIGVWGQYAVGFRFFLCGRGRAGVGADVAC